MSQRYFVETPITADRAVLSGPEAHHLIHVMRLPAGATVTLFDGSGCEFAARIEHVRHAEVELGILARAEVDRELPRRLVLGVALPKGDRQKWLVEKAVELGLGHWCRWRPPIGGPADRASPGAAAADGYRGLETMRPQPPPGDCPAAMLGGVCRRGGRQFFTTLRPSARRRRI